MTWKVWNWVIAKVSENSILISSEVRPNVALIKLEKPWGTVEMVLYFLASEIQFKIKLRKIFILSLESRIFSPGQPYAVEPRGDCMVTA